MTTRKAFLNNCVFFSPGKFCKHCRCGPEDHDLTDEDDRDGQSSKQLHENHYDNVRDLSSRIHKLNIDDPAVQSEIVTPENDIIIHRIIAENLVGGNNLCIGRVLWVGWRRAGRRGKEITFNDNPQLITR